LVHRLAHMRPFRIRDPIHDFIELATDERRAIDSLGFQRLREIRQLAMTYLVYPGALHTRFEHSLGVCHVAGRLCESLGLDQDDRRVVRAAALLHDIGHGPFSHVSEAVLDERNGINGVHEAISVAIIRTDPQLSAALGKELCKRVADLIGHTGDFAVRSVLRDIVSGPTDADKLDYLLRDSYFAGVHYGEYDLPRLLDTVTRIGDENDLETYLGFHSGGLWAVEGLLLARHHMHRQVYGHKTRVATDIMVQRALSLAIVEGVVGPEAFDVPVVDSKPAPDERFLDAYLKQTDSSVMRRLLDQPTDTPSKDIANRLARRDLLRRSARIDFDDARAELGGPRIGRILDPERLAPLLPRLEEEIAKQLGCPTHLVALRVEEPGNPVYRSPNTGIGSKDILLSFDDRPPDLMQTESEIFRNATEANQRFASLYIPKLQLPTDDRATKLLWEALKTL
jgi:putative nucleotidyltransferase with HDIG domain